MTIKVLDVYGAITAQITAALPNHTRIPNPYVPDQNSWLKLVQGYGLGIRDGFDTNRTVSCILTWKRTFTILVVRKLTTTENNIGSREVIEKDILTDHDTLMKAFYNNLSLSTQATIASVTSDGGVGFLDGDRLKFFTMEINLDVEYQDDPRNV